MAQISSSRGGGALRLQPTGGPRWGSGVVPVRDPRVREHPSLSLAENEREVVVDVMERKVVMVLAMFGRLEHRNLQPGSARRTQRKEGRRLDSIWRRYQLGLGFL